MLAVKESKPIDAIFVVVYLHLLNLGADWYQVLKVCLLCGLRVVPIAEDEIEKKTSTI